MSDFRHASISAIRARMVATSLAVAVAAGLILLATGGQVLSVVMVVCTTLFCSLLCARIVGGAITDIRAEQVRVVSRIVPAGGMADIAGEADDIKALALCGDIIMETLERRRQERNRLLGEIVAAEEQLKAIIHSLLSGDEKEIAQVRDAVAAMEGMNSAFSTIIGEIDEVSGRTEHRASISAQLSATTDTIADNINRYSLFVMDSSSSIEEMARAIRETADNIRALSASTAQTVSSINLIGGSQSTVRDNAERGAAASGNVRDQAQQGLRSMAATLEAMQEIARSNTESFDAINRLSRHSARVGEFLDVIREVVEQTNLLSLNASIIAAQAGERGRAFAVVAEEVRSLARRTSASTREIEELVRNIQKETAAVQRLVTQGRDKVAEGVKISSLANDALVTIEQSAEDASCMVARIAAETIEQAAGIRRITEEAEKNLERVRQITLSTEQQQEGAKLIVKNLEEMRDLTQRINASVKEQANGNRLYLKSVMEDNQRTHELKEEASRKIAVVVQAVDAVRRVEALIATNAAESRHILEGVRTLTRLVEHYRSEVVSDRDDGALHHD